MSEDEDRLVQALTMELERSVEQLDAATLARLSQVRRRALAARRPARWPFWLVPAVAATGVAGLVLALLVSAPAPAPPIALEDLDLLAAREKVEFYDDLEFYEWLELQARSG